MPRHTAIGAASAGLFHGVDVFLAREAAAADVGGVVLDRRLDLGSEVRVLTDELRRARVEAEHVFHQYVVRARKRDDLREFLTKRGIGSEVYYPIPLHLQPALAYLGYRAGDLPESERATGEVLALPMFPELTEDEQKYVVENVAEFYS